MHVFCLLSVPSHTLEPGVVGDGDLLAQVDEHAAGDQQRLTLHPQVLLHLRHLQRFQSITGEGDCITEEVKTSL